VREYLETLDDAAWGAASEVAPKFVSRSDPASQWTSAHKGHAFFAYADNYLIDLKAVIILDVEPTRAIRQAEVGAVKTMIDRTEACFGLKPQRLCGDIAYGAAEILGWSRKNQLSRMCRFGKKANGRMALSAGPTSLSILLPIRTNARAAKRASEIATHARSRRAVAPVNLDAKSPEASMKRRAMW
jgi:hypothetical protein